MSDLTTEASKVDPSLYCDDCNGRGDLPDICGCCAYQCPYCGGTGVENAEVRAAYIEAQEIEESSRAIREQMRRERLTPEQRADEDERNRRMGEVVSYLRRQLYAPPNLEPVLSWVGSAFGEPQPPCQHAVLAPSGACARCGETP